MALTRGVDPTTLAAVAGHFCPALLANVDWPGGELLMHTGLMPLIWDSREWVAVGNMGRLDLPAEDGGLSSGGAALTWVDTVENMAEMLGVNIRGRLVKVWSAVVTQPRGNVLVGEPYRLYTGYFDRRGFPSRRENDSVQYELSFGLADGVPGRSGAGFKHSAEDQAARFPGCTAGRHLIHAGKSARNPPTWPET
jgi:hypothetical protein